MYILEEKLNLEDVYLIFENEIKNNPKYNKNFNKTLLSVEQMYFAYYFFDIKIDNLSYFYINNETNERYNGKLDMPYIMTDSLFILNELRKTNFKEADNVNLCVINDKDYDKKKKLLIKNIKEKALINITNLHKLNKNKNIHIDIAPIEKIDTFNLEIFYEKVYVIKYKPYSHKKEYTSILSDYNKHFYLFDYEKSECYLNYLKRYKYPIQVIPKEFLEDYYDISFNVYLKTLNKLEYENSKVLQRKIKNNIDYEEYNLYKDYLSMGIYYFKNKRYLKRLNSKEGNLRQRILFSFLTLNYQANSGVFLYECAKLNLLHDSTIKKQIYFLQKSYRLGSSEAKKILYDHYSQPMYYDELSIKRYS